MPAYNASKTIRRAVLSTLRALPENSTLWVADDASRDGTLAILRSIKDARLIIRTNDENRGVAATLNALVDESQAMFIARMDADDICLPLRFTSELSLLESGIDAVFAPVVVFGSGGIRPQRLTPIPETVAPYLLLATNPFVHSTLVARRSFFVNSGGYRQVPAEDYDLWVRAATRGDRMLRVSRPTLLYRKHATQLTASRTWKQRAAESEDTRAALATLARKLVGSGEISERLDRMEPSSPERSGAIRAISTLLRDRLLARDYHIARAHFARLNLGLQP